MSFTHADNAREFNKDEAKVDWHDKALWFVREKRDRAANTVVEWEQLRDLASQIKMNTMYKLDEYLLEFEKNAVANGIHIHWARDAKEHNEIVHSILEKHSVKKLVKSKSMLTEECHMNPYLEARGIDVVDTDLGERIVQLAKEPPSHIVMPAIHKKKEEVGELFHEKLGTEEGASDPNYLTYAARLHLREKFLEADAALTGVNFAIAETGGFVVCTNEGNADMGAHLPKVHIACMGLEKIIPRKEHLSVYLRLLARNATGQPITTYSSHFHKPRPGQEMHVVIVDNGRSERLSKKEYVESMKCIRCGGCLNTCPVYRRSGGHSYNYTTPGPIGIVMATGIDKDEFKSLPFACTLCGSCDNVCPAKVPLTEHIYSLRKELAAEKKLPYGKNFKMKAMGVILSSSFLFNFGAKVAGFFLRILPSAITKPLSMGWGNGRELPEIAKESFDDLYKKREVNRD